jgi:hypothetical protein
VGGGVGGKKRAAAARSGACCSCWLRSADWCCKAGCSGLAGVKRLICSSCRSMHSVAWRCCGAECRRPCVAGATALVPWPAYSRQSNGSLCRGHVQGVSLQTDRLKIRVPSQGSTWKPGWVVSRQVTRESGNLGRLTAKIVPKTSFCRADRLIFSSGHNSVWFAPENRLRIAPVLSGSRPDPWVRTVLPARFPA